MLPTKAQREHIELPRSLRRRDASIHFDNPMYSCPTVPAARQHLETAPAYDSGPFARRGETASSPFVAQLLAQQTASGEPVLAEHRDGPALVSGTYRKAGGDPPLYSPGPAIFRFSA